MTSDQPEHHVYVSAFTLGAVSIGGQIVLMREIMILFFGNELATGICLFSWLLWTAAGAFSGAAIARGKTAGFRALFVPLMISCLLLPATVVLARVAKTIMGISQGEIVGIGTMTAVAVVVLLPFCFVSGMLFPLLIRAATPGGTDRDAPARVYLFESIGSSVFGLVTALVLIGRLDSLSIAFLLAALAGLAALFVSVCARRMIPALLSAIIVSLFVLQPLFSFPDLGAITRRIQWKGFTVVESIDSVYGNLTLTGAHSQTTVYDSGILSFTYPDVMESELGVIYPLLLHPKPVRVLLVGGGVSSTLSQILKHPSVAAIDYVELDPALIDLCARHLDPEAARPLSDRRVRVIHEDGRLFVREARDRYDVIIVNMADPVNARINRYFTREFFIEANRRLAPDGVFSISVTSSDEIISPVLASFLGSVSRTLSEVFVHTAAVPGPTAFFVASDSASLVDIDPAVLTARMKTRRIVNTYATEYYLAYQLSDERIGYLRRSIEDAKPVRINTDLSPAVYYYDMVLRSYGLSPEMKIALAEIAGLRPVLPAAALILATLLYGGFLMLWARKRPAPPAAVVVPAALTSGFSEIALTVIVIIAFQTFRGYVYSSLGLIVSAFMIGLATGTAAARFSIERVVRPRRLLGIVQLSYGALCLLVVGVLVFFSKSSAGPVAWGPAAAFSLLNVLTGMIAAFHYVSAVRALGASYVSARTGGWVYGMNLAGAAAGALLASAVLVPLWGLVWTLLLVLETNICAAALVGIGARCMAASPGRSD